MRVKLHTISVHGTDDKDAPLTNMDNHGNLVIGIHQMGGMDSDQMLAVIQHAFLHMATNFWFNFTGKISKPAYDLNIGEWVRFHD